MHDSLYASALAALDAGNLEVADSLAQEMAATGRHRGPVSHVLGLLAGRRRDMETARARLEEAAGLMPDDPGIHCDLGDTCLGMGCLDRAGEAYARARMISADPRRALFGLACVQNRRGDLRGALDYCHQIQRIDPHLPVVRKMIADLHYKTGRIRESIERYRDLLEEDPQRLDCLFNLAIALREIGEVRQSLDCFRRILEQHPGHVQSLYGMALSYRLTRDSHRAIPYLEQVIDKEPGALPQLYTEYRKICAWSGAARVGRLLDRQTRLEIGRGTPVLESPFDVLDRVDDPLLHSQVARSMGKTLASQYPPLWRYPQGGRRRHDRIRVGYLSSDLYDHATAHLAMPLFTRFDRSRFECFVYAYGSSPADEYTQRIKQSVTAFRDIDPLAYRAAAELIHRDEIDVLVDLKGYTTGARLEIVSHRPAPIQIAYLGFPGTTGMDSIDYLIADETIIPASERKHYTEGIIYMPWTYQITDDRQPVDTAPRSRAEHGLPDDGVCFVSFNQPYKIDDEVFAVWMDILAATPGSVLWLLDYTRTSSDALRHHARERGIEEARLIFAPKVRKPAHLSRLQLADIGLDTLVYNGHTTTSDCLWAGVPVITRPGRSFASRVASSLLRACDLPELVTDSLEAYRDLAITLAHDPGRLKDIKQRIAEGRESAHLFDTQGFMQHYERALEIVWREYQEGRPVRDLRRQSIIKPCSSTSGTL